MRNEENNIHGTPLTFPFPANLPMYLPLQNRQRQNLSPPHRRIALNPLRIPHPTPALDPIHAFTAKPHPPNPLRKPQPHAQPAQPHQPRRRDPAPRHGEVQNRKASKRSRSRRREATKRFSEAGEREGGIGGRRGGRGCGGEEW
jgi:hypothetical protein